ncbi:hypothetical protein OVY48_07380 [Sphingobium sp. SA2]|nr:hypothetical protein [Sphingobium sp. SA2]MDT7533248.1 hypothetical protein [Sphingobium sp. SA2]
MPVASLARQWGAPVALVSRRQYVPVTALPLPCPNFCESARPPPTTV